MDIPIPTPSIEHSPQGWATTPWRFLLLSLYWLPVSLFWGMMLSQILPARVEDFAGPLRKGTFLNEIAVPGAAAAAVIQLLIGPLSDGCRARWGRRRPFLLVGTLGAVGAMVLFAHAQSFAGLVAAFFAIQLLLNVANGPYQAFIPDHVPTAFQGKASAWMGLMQLLGEAGGPVLAGIALGGAAKMADRMHLGPLATQALTGHAIQQLLRLDAGMLVLAMLVSVLLVPDGPAQGARPTGEAWRGMFRVRPREHPDFFRLLVSRAVFNLGFYIALDFLAYYIQDSLHQGKEFHTPLMYVQIIAIGAALVGTFPAGALADRVSKKRVIYASCALTAVAGVAFALASGLTFAYAMAVFFGLGYGIFRAVDWAFACNLLPSGGAAKYMAIWSLSATLPQVFAPAFGVVADALNRRLGLGFGWRAAMMASVVSVIWGAVLIRKVHEVGEGTPRDIGLSGESWPPTPSLEPEA